MCGVSLHITPGLAYQCCSVWDGDTAVSIPDVGYGPHTYIMQPDREVTGLMSRYCFSPDYCTSKLKKAELTCMILSSQPFNA